MSLRRWGSLGDPVHVTHSIEPEEREDILYWFHLRKEERNCEYNRQILIKPAMLPFSYANNLKENQSFFPLFKPRRPCCHQFPFPLDVTKGTFLTFATRIKVQHRTEIAAETGLRWSVRPAKIFTPQKTCFLICAPLKAQKASLLEKPMSDCNMPHAHAEQRPVPKRL